MLINCKRPIALAKQYLKDGKIEQAYFTFGIGLHALQDATSPSHNGFQFWGNNESIGQLLGHVQKELIYPGSKSNLQNITNKYLDWFENSNAPLPKENLFNGIHHD